MKKFILEVGNDEITEFGLKTTLEDYFKGLYIDGEVERLTPYTITEIETMIEVDIEDVCKYCDPKMSFATKGITKNTFIAQDVLIELSRNTGESDHVIINYCPMCGRKLNPDIIGDSYE